MNLLASGMSYENKITIIILCVSVAVFIIADFALLFSLHSKNKRLVRRRQRKKENTSAEP